MRIQVVGAGIFGCMAALKLAAEGHRVQLIEADRDLMMGASRCNQGRLHRGYHYPRSPETARAARDEADRFKAMFPSAVREYIHYYAIADSGSLTGAEEFIAFCDEQGLQLVPEAPSFLRGVSACFRVPESFIDLDHLRELFRHRLERLGVETLFGEVGPRGSHDLTVLATYGRSMDGLMKHERTEIALYQLSLPPVSVVVMDGPFVCLDPTPTPGLFMLYGVRESVHGSPDAILSRAREFLDLGAVTYAGSLKTTRMVLASAEMTDARPSLVRRDGNVISVFGGKIGTCVAAAEQVVAEVNQAVAA